MSQRPSRHRGIRPRVQRAFFAWYRENRLGFAVMLRISKRSDRLIHIAFEGVTPMIVAHIDRQGASVDVECDGAWFDRLVDLDVAPQRVQNGYRCSLCEAEAGKREPLPTLEALWIDHLFEPFRCWVNDRLASAHSLQLLTSSDGRRIAQLLRDGTNVGGTDQTMRRSRPCRALPETPAKRHYGRAPKYWSPRSGGHVGQRFRRVKVMLRDRDMAPEPPLLRAQHFRSATSPRLEDKAQARIVTPVEPDRTEGSFGEPDTPDLACDWSTSPNRNRRVSQ